MKKGWKEKIRDKSRDNLYQNLVNIGVDCELAERGINEEKLFNPWYRRSLGIININSNSPIKYVNIIKQDRSKDSPPRWWCFFAIPSYKIRAKDDYLEVKTIRKKTFPIFGKVKFVIWKSNDKAKKLAEKFTEDPEINELVMKLGDIKVQSLRKNFSGYSIELESRLKQIPSLNLHQWNMLNRISSMCLDLDT